MEYVPFGNTGKEVSVMALGAGGYSKLGLRDDRTEAEAVAVVEEALELGINLIDTAEAYGTEAVVGEGISEYDRSEVVLSSKFRLHEDGDRRPPGDIHESLEASLDRLGTDYLDVYHLHGVRPRDYEYAVSEWLPELQTLRDDGLIDHVGITESNSQDPAHEMLSTAVEDDGWEVMMVGYNLLNHTAKERVLEPATNRGIATIGMVAVRRALSDRTVLRETVEDLVERGEVDPDVVDPESPFDFLLDEDGVEDLYDAAYRFCRHEPTIDTVLTGTGSREHLRANVESARRDSLPDRAIDEVRRRFGAVESTLAG